jgi:hypothetical protein
MEDPKSVKMRPHEKLKRYCVWSPWGEGVPTVKLDETSVTSLEGRYAIQIPPDFREYLLQSCPANENASTISRFGGHLLESKQSQTSVNMRSRIRPYQRTHKYLFFADYSIWCWAWAIACGEDDNRGRIVVISGTSDRFVADSFAEFVDRYIEDPTQVA